MKKKGQQKCHKLLMTKYNTKLISEYNKNNLVVITSIPLFSGIGCGPRVLRCAGIPHLHNG
jgi:hypothetical protein